MKLPTLVMAGIFAAGIFGLFGRSSAAELKIGDKAPDWELKGSDAKAYKLSELVKKQVVVVAWYPKAATPG